MKKEKYIRFTYNSGKVTDVKYEDYLKNIGYWSGVSAIQETIYKLPWGLEFDDKTNQLK